MNRGKDFARSSGTGNVKIVLVIMLLMLFFERRATPLNVVGFATFIAGSAFYSALTDRATLAANQERAPLHSQSGGFHVSRPHVERATEKTTLVVETAHHV